MLAQFANCNQELVSNIFMSYGGGHGHVGEFIAASQEKRRKFE